MISIKESGMNFEFDEEMIFEIETSKLHRQVGNGIKTVEFIVSLKDNELSFIEAKSSSPRPTKENEEKFDKFIAEISEKFLHSFNLYMSAIMKRNTHDEIKRRFFEMDNSVVKFKFILIIKGHSIEWLAPLKDALERSLLYHNRIWKSNIILMNDELARAYNLVK